MPCKFSQSDLLDFVNHETPRLRSWTIRRHAAVCVKCADELAAVRQFQTVLHGADLLPPETAPVPVRRPAPRRRVYAAALAAVFVGSFFLFPVLHRGRSTVQNPGTAIAAALGRVNTWHFVGWKQIDGRRVPWEVWGRRAPWLYYERVGDTVTWSDGKTYLRVFPPSPVLKRPQGLVIKNLNTMSGLETDFLSDPAYQSLVSDGRSQFNFMGDGFTVLYAQTATVAKYRRQNYQGMNGVNENKLYTISKRDWLPTTYQLHFENSKLSRDTEYFQVHYGEDLPDEVIAAPSPSGYSIVDFTHPGLTFLAGGTTNQEQGFRVQATPLARDKEGNLLISVRGWLGGNRLTPDSTFSLDVALFNASNSLIGERGHKTVKYLYASNTSVRPAADILLPYEPLEPSEAASAPPKTFLLTLSASPQVLVRGSDLLDQKGQIQPATRTLTANSLQFAFAAPQKTVSSLAAARPPGTPEDFHLPTQSEYYSQRRIYYSMSYDFQGAFYKKVLPRKIWQKFQNSDGAVDYFKMNSQLSAQEIDRLQRMHAAEFRKAEQGFRARAAYWQRKIVALPYQKGTTPGDRANHFVHHAYDLELLAYCYKTSGDKTNQDKTLHELVRLLEGHPELNSLRRNAGYTLRTGQFPSYPDQER